MTINVDITEAYITASRAIQEEPEQAERLLQEAIRFRATIEEGQLTEREATRGICVNIDLSSYKSSLLKKITSSWPKFSGNAIYPVPSTTNPTCKLSAGKSYDFASKYKCLYKTDTKYGRNRIELLDYIIRVITDNL